MKALLTAKVGMFLVVSSVLAIWTLLAAQHVQAHTHNASPDQVVAACLTDADFFIETQRQPAPISMSDDSTPQTNP